MPFAKAVLPLWLILLLAAPLGSRADEASGRLIDLRTRREIGLEASAPALARQRVVIVGEHHSNRRHHQGQLAVIRSLHHSGARLAVGMEMFRQDSQATLDRWMEGSLDERAFREAWDDNWGYNWDLYAAILEYVRKEKIPLVGLNVPREITRQVARNGFASLNPEQRGALHHIACRVDADYMRYIREAFGGHAHGGLNFEYFCEAQLVWDSVMAIHARDWLAAHPGQAMVILAGTGHAHKLGIPAQLAQLAPELSVTVILPEVAGRGDAADLDGEDADFLLKMPD